MTYPLPLRRGRVSLAPLRVQGNALNLTWFRGWGWIKEPDFPSPLSPPTRGGEIFCLGHFYFGYSWLFRISPARQTSSLVSWDFIFRIQILKEVGLRGGNNGHPG